MKTLSALAISTVTAIVFVVFLSLKVHAQEPAEAATNLPAGNPAVNPAPGPCSLLPAIAGTYKIQCEVLINADDGLTLTGSDELLQIQQNSDDLCQISMATKMVGDDADAETISAHVGSFTHQQIPQETRLSHSDFDLNTQTLEVVIATEKLGAKSDANPETLSLTISKLSFKGGTPRLFTTDVSLPTDETIDRKTCQVGEKVNP